MHSHPVTAEPSQNDVKPDNCAAGGRDGLSDAATDTKTNSSQYDCCSSCAQVGYVDTSRFYLSGAVVRSAQCNSHSPTNWHHKPLEPRGTERPVAHKPRSSRQRNQRSWPSLVKARYPRTKTPCPCGPSVPSQSSPQTSYRQTLYAVRTSKSSRPYGCWPDLPASQRACDGRSYAQPQNGCSP